ncbi:ankyrin repeat-containing domain protein, partial [Baffinella frigidus]
MSTAKEDGPPTAGKLLLEAAKVGKLKELRSLIAGKANIEEQDSLGNTPLHVAASNGHDGMVKELLEKGANHSAKAKDASTPLHRAAAGGHEGAIRMLVMSFEASYSMRKADRIDAMQVEDKGNGFMGLLMKELGDRLRAPLQNGSTPLHEGGTPLHVAASNGQATAMRILLDAGAKKGGSDGGESPLHWAATNGHEGAILVLLEAGANKDSKTK